MLAVGIGPIGPIEGLIILAIVVIIFGVGRLPEVGGAIGKSLREFRKAAKEPERPPEEAETAPRHCTNCGAEMAEAIKFCAQCGAPTQAAVQ